eukprot:8807734-Pyramimonas_sp.AAC.1
MQNNLIEPMRDLRDSDSFGCRRNRLRHVMGCLGWHHQVSPKGAVSTLAGQCGVEGHADGSAANALFASPAGIAVDLFGNVFVAGECRLARSKLAFSVQCRARRGH